MFNISPSLRNLTGALIFLTTTLTSADEQLTIQLELAHSWETVEGRNYQLQGAEGLAAPWVNIGSTIQGDGTLQIFNTPTNSNLTLFRVEETTPGSSAEVASLVNGGFEDGNNSTANHWITGGSQRPQRTNGDARSGNYSMRAAIQNVGSTANEAIISQLVVAEGGSIQAGQAHPFSFWIKQISTGASYVQQYEVEWFDALNSSVGSSGLQSFSGAIDSWVKISSQEDLIAPAGAVEARVRFRFVTGAVSGGGGEVLLDDVGLGAPSVAIEDDINVLPVTSIPISTISWNSRNNIIYQPISSVDLTTWTNVGPEVIGTGGQLNFSTPRTQLAEFYKLQFTESVDPLEGTDITRLFSELTQLEPEISIETEDALITYLGDRARDRHAREDFFQAYDHYLPYYWQERSMNIEITDEVAKGGSQIIFNYTTQSALNINEAEFRAFFRGIGTVAEYHQNQIAEYLGPDPILNPNNSPNLPQRYRAVIATSPPGFPALSPGFPIEIEISQFLASPVNGRSNYYGTTFLYVVGQGVVPWEGIPRPNFELPSPAGVPLDSFPLPEEAWLGGLTTLPYQYSDEPDNQLKQTAGNIAPISIQPFLLGRRLHHTDFEDGSHSEAGNPIFSEHIGKLGNAYINNSCVACHTNNGRALAPEIGASMLQSIVRVGDDAEGNPHSILGAVLQPRSITGNAEADVQIASYSVSSGTYGDGTAFSLRQPNYSFSGVTPEFYSVRVAPPLVGLGLLEAIDEASILALADPEDENNDGISGRAQTVTDPTTGETRVGRFSSRASQSKLIDQVAAALNTDMGVTTSIKPILDGQTSSSGSPEISDTDLDLMRRYLALLGVSARRDLNDPVALRGEQLFNSIGCASCHTPTHTTSSFHPMAELRNQTIHPYTDLLLHDMGPGLADNMGEENASGAEWRTPPLWSIGLTAGTSGGEGYLHDGRARSLEEAILWHGGEGEAAKEEFRTLNADERTALIKFLKSL